MTRLLSFAALLRLVLSPVSALGAPETTTALPPAPSAVTTGTVAPSVPTLSGKVGDFGYQFNALLQAWTVNDTTPSAANPLNFRLRRAELKLSGNVASSVRYFVMLDPAKAINPQGDARVLQDLGIGFTIVKGLEVVAGQFKTLTTAEGLVSSADLLLPERSFTSRFYGDRREPGAMVAYTGKGYKVAAMVSNGQGANTDSTKTAKDFSARVDVSVIKAVSVGAYAQLGDFQYAKRGSWGINTRVIPVRDLILGAELDIGRTNGINNAGVVFEAAYLVTDQLQPIVRHELFKADVDRPAVSQQTTLGVNYLVLKNTAKLQAALSLLNNMKGDNGSPRTLSAGANGTLFTVVFQAAI